MGGYPHGYNTGSQWHYVNTPDFTAYHPYGKQMPRFVQNSAGYKQQKRIHALYICQYPEAQRRKNMYSQFYTGKKNKNFSSLRNLFNNFKNALSLHFPARSHGNGGGGIQIHGC